MKPLFIIMLFVLCVTMPSSLYAEAKNDSTRCCFEFTAKQKEDIPLPRDGMDFDLAQYADIRIHCDITQDIYIKCTGIQNCSTPGGYLFEPTIYYKNFYLTGKIPKGWTHGDPLHCHAYFAMKPEWCLSKGYTFRFYFFSDSELKVPYTFPCGHDHIKTDSPLLFKETPGKRAFISFQQTPPTYIPLNTGTFLSQGTVLLSQGLSDTLRVRLTHNTWEGRIKLDTNIVIFPPNTTEAVFSYTVNTDPPYFDEPRVWFSHAIEEHNFAQTYFERFRHESDFCCEIIFDENTPNRIIPTVRWTFDSAPNVTLAKDEYFPLRFDIDSTVIAPETFAVLESLIARQGMFVRLAIPRAQESGCRTLNVKQGDKKINVGERHTLKGDSYEFTLTSLKEPLSVAFPQIHTDQPIPLQLEYVKLNGGSKFNISNTRAPTFILALPDAKEKGS